MAEFIFLYRANEQEQRENMGTPEAAQKSMQAWMAWMEELKKKGALKDFGQPLDRGGKVVRGPKKQVIDGPYAETKDIVNGFSIIEAKDLAHAAELAQGCPILRGSGAVEIRPVLKLM